MAPLFVPKFKSLGEQTVFLPILYCVDNILFIFILRKTLNICIDDDTKRGWYNRAAASTHASTLFILALAYWYAKYTGNVGVSFNSELWSSMCVDIMIAYLIYDTTHECFFTRDFDHLTLAHHILGGCSLASARYYDCTECFALQMVIFLAESSTPFLHIGWLFFKLKFSADNSTVFVGTYVILMILFFVFRVCLGPALTYYTFQNVEMRENFFGLYCVNCVVVLIFTLLQFKWFYMLANINSKTKKSKKK